MADWRAGFHVARDSLVLVLAVTAAVGSALAVIHSVHVSRERTSQLQALVREHDQLQVQWGQLLLEKSTWGSYARVEQTARARLDMYLPAVQEIVVVQP